MPKPGKTKSKKRAAPREIVETIPGASDADARAALDAALDAHVAECEPLAAHVARAEQALLALEARDDAEARKRAALRDAGADDDGWEVVTYLGRAEISSVGPGGVLREDAAPTLQGPMDTGVALEAERRHGDLWPRPNSVRRRLMLLAVKNDWKRVVAPSSALAGTSARPSTPSPARRRRGAAPVRHVAFFFSRARRGGEAFVATSRRRRDVAATSWVQSRRRRGGRRSLLFVNGEATRDVPAVAARRRGDAAASRRRGDTAGGDTVGGDVAGGRATPPRLDGPTDRRAPRPQAQEASARGGLRARGGLLQVPDEAQAPGRDARDDRRVARDVRAAAEGAAEVSRGVGLMFKARVSVGN